LIEAVESPATQDGAGVEPNEPALVVVSTLVAADDGPVGVVEPTALIGPTLENIELIAGADANRAGVKTALLKSIWLASAFAGSNDGSVPKSDVCPCFDFFETFICRFCAVVDIDLSPPSH
jgi:hypothetical protein